MLDVWTTAHPVLTIVAVLALAISDLAILADMVLTPAGTNDELLDEDGDDPRGGSGFQW